MPLTYLALGDSYTIGESVPLPECFPMQVVQLLSEDKIPVDPPHIIAKTGWTTAELEEGIHDTRIPLRVSYDFVSLLIGVNNQYRGQSLESYKQEFEGLLKKALRFVANHSSHVIVLSIPDWGVTPYAEGRDRTAIAKEIDAFNAANKSVAAQYNAGYLDITPWTREAANDGTLLTSDGLHPSGKEYKRWSVKIAEYFKSKIYG